MQLKTNSQGNPTPFDTNKENDPLSLLLPPLGLVVEIGAALTRAERLKNWTTISASNLWSPSKRDPVHLQKRRCHTNGFLHIILDYVNPLSRAGLPAYKTSYLPDPKNVLSIELSLRSIINLAQSPSRHSEYKNMLKLFFFRTFLMKKAKPNIFSWDFLAVSYTLYSKGLCT